MHLHVAIASQGRPRAISDEAVVFGVHAVEGGHDDVVCLNALKNERDRKEDLIDRLFSAIASILNI